MTGYWLIIAGVIGICLGILHAREEVTTDPYNSFLEIDPTTETGRERRRILERAGRDQMDERVEELS